MRAASDTFGSPLLTYESSPIMHAIPRLALAFATAIGAVLAVPAMAQEEDVLCRGKYAFAAEMLDATYSKRGTLYSGAGMIGVGASLDLWRLLVGLPDYNFRGGEDMFKVLYHRIDPPGSPWDGFVSPEWARFAFDKLLPYATAPNDQVAYPGPRVWVRVMLDVLTPTGPSPDWWINPERRKDLTHTELIVADTAAENDLVDWMLGVVIQARLPATISRGGNHDDRRRQSFAFTLPALQTLESHYWQRFDRSSGIEWAILAVLFSSSPKAVDRAEDMRLGWEAAVRDCSANPAEYVAFAVSTYDSEQQNIFSTPFPAPDAAYTLLPPAMKDRLVAGEAFQLLARESAAYRTDYGYAGNWRPLRSTREEPGVELERAKAAIGSLPKPQHGQLPVAEVLMLMADDVDELGAIINEYGLGGGTDNLLAMLSAEDLFMLAQGRPESEKFRHSVDGDKAALAWSAFLRFLALGQYEEANRALKLVAETDYRFEGLFAKYTAMDAPLEVRLALLALDVPKLTLRVAYWSEHREIETPQPWRWVRNGYYSPDLPDWVRFGAPVQRAVEKHLRSGRFWYAVKSERSYWRGTPWGLSSPIEPEFIAFPPRGPNVAGVPFGKLVAMDELQQLGPETGLTQRLSEIIIRWADEGSDEWDEVLAAQATPMSEALARIVRLNRYRSVGEVDGIFAGKRAFQVLHDRFPLSKAARETPVWWKCTDWTCDR